MKSWEDFRSSGTMKSIHERITERVTEMKFREIWGDRVMPPIDSRRGAESDFSPIDY